VLPAYVPDLEIHVAEIDGRDVLADGGDGFLGGGGGGGEVEGFDGGEEGGLAGVVEAEEEDGVFCTAINWELMGRRDWKRWVYLLCWLRRCRWLWRGGTWWWPALRMRVCKLARRQLLRSRRRRLHPSSCTQNCKSALGQRFAMSCALW